MAEVRTVAVIGAGIMGRGIAHAASLGGYRTILEDLLPNALRRAELARDVLAERLGGGGILELRFDFIGLNSIHGPQLSANAPAPYEVCLRAAGRAPTLRAATRVPREVEALYTNGPAGGGGAAGSTKEVIAIHSALIPRDAITQYVHYEES